MHIHNPCTCNTRSGNSPYTRALTPAHSALTPAHSCFGGTSLSSCRNQPAGGSIAKALEDQDFASRGNKHGGFPLQPASVDSPLCTRHCASCRKGPAMRTTGMSLASRRSFLPKGSRMGLHAEPACGRLTLGQAWVPRAVP